MERVAKRRICLYGNSVILGTVGASLQCFPQFDVMPLPSELQEEHKLEELKPDVIFFDLEARWPSSAFCLLENCPGLLLVGISPSNNLVRIWSGRQLHELSTQNLVDFLDAYLMNSLNSNPGSQMK